MMKKGSVLLVALLLSLPGCKKGAKQDDSKKNKKMAQRGDLFTRVNMPLAEEDLVDAGDDVKGLMLDELDEFVAFTDGDKDGSQFCY